MNRLKSVFITLFMLGTSLTSGISIHELFAHGFSLSWLGALVSNGVPFGFIGFLMITRSKARTSVKLPLLTAIITVGAGIGVAGFIRNGNDPVLALVFSLSGFLCWLVYDIGYSRFGRKDNTLLAIDKQMPLFEINDANGNIVKSASFLGSRALYLFYRGNWCPLCMAQIKEIAGQYRELAQRGVRIILISPQPLGHTQKLAGRFRVPFTFLIDEGNKVAKQLQILDQNGVPFGMEILGYDSDTVLPTVIITDSNGKITFADLTDNYRVRPEPATFLRILDQSEENAA